LPPGAIHSLDRENDPVNFIYHLVLPATALSTVQIGIISRYVRISMLEVLGEDFIRTAFAKGVAGRRVVLKHALKNALLPLITTIALALPGILSGLILVEAVFAYPGLGRLFYLSSGGTFTATQGSEFSPDFRLGSTMDVPVALVLFLLMIIVVAVANTVADVLYAAADPRVTFGSNKTR
jgi:peptide/nickel transport system permease protein